MKLFLASLVAAFCMPAVAAGIPQRAALAPSFRVDNLFVSTSSELYQFAGCVSRDYTFVSGYAELSTASFSCKRLLEGPPVSWTYTADAPFSLFAVNGIQWHDCDLISVSFDNGVVMWVSCR